MLKREPLNLEHAPARVTFSDQGEPSAPGAPRRLLVTIPDANLVRVQDEQGHLVQDFEGVLEPVGIAVVRDRVFVGSANRGSVEAFAWEDGRIGAPLASVGRGEGEFGRPVDIAVSPVRGDLLISDLKRGTLRIFSAFTLQEIGSVTASAIRRPAGVAFAPDGTLYVSSIVDREVHAFRADYSYWRRITRDGTGPGETACPIGLTVDVLGRLYVVDSFLGQVLLYDANGLFQRSIGAIGKGPGLLETPQSAAVDPRDLTLAVTDGQGRQVEFYQAQR